MDSNQSDAHSEAIEIELQAIRAKRKVVEMTPYGPVLDAPKANTRERCETVLNDPSACLSAKRQARAWLRSNRIYKRPSGNKHYMVIRKRKRLEEFHRYWKEYDRMLLKKFRQDHRPEPVEFSIPEYAAIFMHGRKVFGKGCYNLLRKDTTKAWSWDNTMLAYRWNNEKRVDIVKELARPPELSKVPRASKTRSNSPSQEGV